MCALKLLFLVIYCFYVLKGTRFDSISRGIFSNFRLKGGGRGELKWRPISARLNERFESVAQFVLSVHV